jgi:hypothetical protein
MATPANMNFGPIRFLTLVIGTAAASSGEGRERSFPSDLMVESGHACVIGWIGANTGPALEEWKTTAGPSQAVEKHIVTSTIGYIHTFVCIVC